MTSPVFVTLPSQGNRVEDGMDSVVDCQIYRSVHSRKSVEFFYTLPSTPVCSWHSLTEVWTLSMKSVEFFYSTLSVQNNCTLLCYYKFHNNVQFIYTDCAAFIRH